MCIAIGFFFLLFFFIGGKPPMKKTEKNKADGNAYANAKFD